MPLNAENTPARSGRFPDTISPVIRVDPNRAILDTLAHHLVVDTIDQALAYVAENPLTRPVTPPLNKNGWVVECAPGLHEVAEAIDMSALVGATLTGYHAVGDQADSLSVTINVAKEVNAGALIKLGEGCCVKNFQITWNGANGPAGGTIAGPVSVVEVESGVYTDNVVENVYIDISVAGAGNDAHPVILINHPNPALNPNRLTVRNCRLSMTNSIAPHPASRYIRLQQSGLTGGNETRIEGTAFISFSGANTVDEAVETSRATVLRYERCVFTGWAGKICHHQDGGTADVEVKGLVYDGGVSVTNGPSILVDRTFNAPAAAAADPGIENEIRPTATGIQRHNGTQWEAAALPWVALP